MIPLPYSSNQYFTDGPWIAQPRTVEAISQARKAVQPGYRRGRFIFVLNRFALLAMALPAVIVAWGASLAGSIPDEDADVNRIVNSMIHEQATRFDHLQSYSRIQR